MTISARQALKDNNVDLVKQLPLENAVFFAMAKAEDLFPLNIGESIQAEKTRAEKVTFFLNFIDSGADTYLPKLLKVMKGSGVVNVVQLAEKMAVATGMDGGSNSLT